ncbi:WSC-domain-containing protein [Marasmius fiardii PR-910]|nr:WSC-domain-containing protein [Marasmius fiardii PR-910]
MPPRSSEMVASKSFLVSKSLLVLPLLLGTVRAIPKPRALEENLNLPSGWTAVGCFSDLSTARTLQAASTSSDGMTVELCIAACGDSYVFAGVEFGQECYCDSTIQLPGAPVDASECSMPCAGNSSETCGNTNRIQIFTNGRQSPVIPTEIDTDDGGFRSEWTFEGCFVDNPSSRVLSQPFGVPSGVTLATCVEACLEASFSMAGLEDGRECWCDGASNILGLSPNATKAPDTDCRGVCIADHNEYCGNANRIAVYSMTEHDLPPPESPRNCSVVLGNITMSAKTNEGEEFPLKIVTVEMVPSISWGVLSACPLCCSDYQYFTLSDLVYSRSLLNPTNQFMLSVDPVVGESPSFMAPPVINGPLPQGDESYCVTGTTQTLLSFKNETSGFSLCKNNSVIANGRMDVVFQPIAGHPNYVLEDCKDIVINVAGLLPVPV